MLVSSLRAPGLLLFVMAVFVVAASGCTDAESARPAAGADAAVPSYAAPSGAPVFCADLAATTHLTDIPEAVGRLTADPRDVEAGLALTAAMAELDAVIDRVRVTVGFRELDTSLEVLVGALEHARDGSTTEAVRTAISTGLDDVGRKTQAVCGFPS